MEFETEIKNSTNSTNSATWFIAASVLFVCSVVFIVVGFWVGRKFLVGWVGMGVVLFLLSIVCAGIGVYQNKHSGPSPPYNRVVPGIVQDIKWEEINP